MLDIKIIDVDPNCGDAGFGEGWEEEDISHVASRYDDILKDLIEYDYPAATVTLTRPKGNLSEEIMITDPDRRLTDSNEQEVMEDVRHFQRRAFDRLCNPD